MAKQSWKTLLVVITDPFANAHPVIGNTAERVIDQVACDLLVMKPAGLQAERRERPPRMLA